VAITLAELTTETWPSPRLDGVAWTFRQPGDGLARDTAQRSMAGMSRQAISLAIKTTTLDEKSQEYAENASKFSEEVDVTELIGRNREMAAFVFRVCVLSVSGIEGFDLSEKRTQKVDIGGIPMKMIDDETMGLLDAGLIGGDIRELGELLLSRCKLAAAKKKT